VTGIRRGIEEAISVKKNSSSIVEAISAEDIGKLPDTSIAESIARLPGLAAQRVAGRAQSISVRGLSPDFATTLLNGREQVSTGDNRGVEFDQYPSELLSGVTVYKTPDAGLVGQGLSGTIDLQLARPLDFSGRTISINVRGERNSLGPIANAKATGHRFSASYIDQFANRTFGVALGIAEIASPILDNETGTYEPFSKDSRAGLTPGTWNTAGVKSLAKSGDLKRTGFIGVLDYRPSKEWRSTLDVFSSKFRQDSTNNQFEVNLGGYNGNNNPQGFAYQSTNIVNGTLLGGTATGAYPLVRGQYDHREDEIKTAGWANKFKFEKWSLLADLNYSQAKRNEFYVENNLQLGIPGVSFVNDPLLTVGWEPGRFATLGGKLNYSDPTKLVSGDTIYGFGETFTPHLKDTLKSFKLVATVPVPGALENTFRDIDVGLNISDRTKTKRQEDGKLTANGNPTISSDLLYAPVNLGFAGSGIVPSWNVPGVIAKYFNPLDFSTAAANADIARTWDVTEKVDTGFVKANIESELDSNVSLRGNIGAQIIRTDQSSTSFVGFKGGRNPVTDGKVYNDVLPSLNLAFGLADQQTVRFGLAKQVARPRLDQLNAGFDFSVSTSTRLPSGSGGNARLDPWRASAADISYEKYFGNKAYFAVAGFYKKLTSYIYNFSESRDFSQFIVPANGAISNIGQYTAPRNGTGGGLKGAELTVSLPFSMLTPVLDGFGVSASATYTDSSINIQETNNTIGKIQLPGLSKTVSNLTLYYEKYGFSTRISQRRRSDFVGEIGDYKGDRQLRYVVGETVTDLQVGYTFNEGSFKGLGLVLQVNNLNNAAYETYANSPDHQLEYAKYGKTILFGANYKF
jgi:TonB-dependent receptor